jgi:hypothetical protein
MLHLEHSFCGAENRPMRKVDRNYVEGFEMWCCSRIETNSWTDHVRNEEVLRRVKEDLNILHIRRQSKTHWAGHILSRTCPLILVIESKIEWAAK